MRGGKDFDDAASDVSLSSTTSGYRSGRGQTDSSLRNPVLRIRIRSADPDPAEACQALHDTEIKI